MIVIVSKMFSFTTSSYWEEGVVVAVIKKCRIPLPVLLLGLVSRNNYYKIPMYATFKNKIY